MNHKTGDIVIYTTPTTTLALPIDAENGTVWASQAQIVELFEIDVSRVSRHLSSIFKDGEVSKVSNLRKTQIANSDKPVSLYSLDVILAVGYRARSSRAIEFRQWASRVLSQYALDGVALNKQRLDELGSIVQVLRRSDNELVSGVADVIAEYLPGLELLREYDEGQFQNTKYGTTPGWQLDLDQARHVIAQVGSKFPQDRLFGIERSEQLEGIIAAIYQGFGDSDVYPTVEEKAANLLYFIIKDHPLSDGNKRSAAAIFVTFLERNKILFDNNGLQKISNNALAAITLLVATSDPREKNLMVALVMRMVSNND